MGRKLEISVRTTLTRRRKNKNMTVEKLKERAG